VRLGFIMEFDYDFIIVGAGIAGLGCGGLLAKAGKRVLVLEKGSFIGGRAATFKKEGVTHSFGQHVMMKDLNFEDLLQRLDVKQPKRAFFEQTFLTFEGELRNLDDLLPKLAKQAPKDFMRMGRLLASDVDLEILDDLSAEKWLSDFVSNGSLKGVFQLSGAIMTTIPRLEEMSASVLYKTIQLILNHREIWIATEGLQKIFKDISTKIKENGGNIATRTAVENLIIEDDKISGVLIRDMKDGKQNKFLAPNIILAIPCWDLLPLIQDINIATDFQERVQNLSVRTANVGITALLPKPVYNGSKFFMVDFPSIEYPGSIFMPTNIAPELAPEGKHLFDASIICNYNDAVNKSQLRSKMVAGLKQDLTRWFPNWDNDAYWIKPYFHYEEPKRSPGKAGKHRIGNSVPEIEGLYFAGDCYASRALPGLECASESAIMCVKEVLGA
jgi:phytoene dehydrogenase-like protein